MPLGTRILSEPMHTPARMFLLDVSELGHTHIEHKAQGPSFSGVSDFRLQLTCLLPAPPLVLLRLVPLAVRSPIQRMRGSLLIAPRKLQLASLCVAAWH